MRKLLDILLGRPGRREPVREPSVSHGANDAIERSSRRMEALAHGLAIPAADLVGILMPRETFSFLAEQQAKGTTPLTLYTADDFNMPAKDSDKSVHDRLVMKFNDGEFSLAHERQCMWQRTRHPEAPDDEFASYIKPVFLELAKISGFIEGDKAFVTTSALVHPYGAVDVTATKPEHLDYFRELRKQAEASPREAPSDTPPPLPSVADRAALGERITAMRAAARRNLDEAIRLNGQAPTV